MVEMAAFVLRLITPLLLIVIAFLCFYSLRYGRRQEHALIALDDENRSIRYPVLYWENSLGRGSGSDIRIGDITVSRDHAVLLRRENGWFITDTGSKAGVFINGVKTNGRQAVYVGDKITLGMTELTLRRADDPTTANQRQKIKEKKERKTVPCPAILSVMTLYFLVLSGECFLNMGNADVLPHTFLLIAIMWGFYALSSKLFKRKSFELEALAVLLSGSGILLTAAHDTRQAYSQLVAMVLGMVGFCLMLWFIEVPDRVMKWRILIYLVTIGLLGITLILGKNLYGAKNWIIIGPFSIQPSEFAKMAYIFVGAATLDQLQTKKNLLGFIFVTGICIGLLFFMSDFGTALIFFVTFLVISFM